MVSLEDGSVGEEIMCGGGKGEGGGGKGKRERGFLRFGDRVRMRGAW